MIGDVMSANQDSAQLLQPIIYTEKEWFKLFVQLTHWQWPLVFYTCSLVRKVCLEFYDGENINFLDGASGKHSCTLWIFAGWGVSIWYKRKFSLGNRTHTYLCRTENETAEENLQWNYSDTSIYHNVSLTDSNTCVSVWEISFRL